MWSTEETRKFLVGYNRHYESSEVFAKMVRDTELGFSGIRSNVSMKDRLRTLEEADLLTTFKSFFILKNTQTIDYEPRIFIPEEFLSAMEDGELEDSVPILDFADRIPVKEICYPLLSLVNNLLFADYLEQLPLFLEEDPVNSSITWKQVCQKYFQGRERLNDEKAQNLITRLIENGHIKSKVVGIRTYIYKA